MRISPTWISARQTQGNLCFSLRRWPIRCHPSAEYLQRSSMVCCKDLARLGIPLRHASTATSSGLFIFSQSFFRALQVCRVE